MNDAIELPRIGGVLDFSSPQDSLVLRIDNAAFKALDTNPSHLSTDMSHITPALLDGVGSFTTDHNGSPSIAGGLEALIHFTGGGTLSLQGVNYTSFKSFASGQLIFNHA